MGTRKRSNETISQHQFPTGTGLREPQKMLQTHAASFCLMEIKVLAQRFCEEARHFRGYTEHTIRRYRTTVELFSKQAGVTDIVSVTPEAVRDWFFCGRSKRSWSVQTFRTYHKSLKVFFRWCRKQTWLATDPLADLAVPRAERSLPPRLTREEALRLLEITQNYPWANAFLRHRNQGIIATFLFAGLRKSELLHLSFTDTDLTGLSIFVRRGKGRKDRIVPVSETLAEILRPYIQERRRWQKTCPEFFARHDVNAGLSDEVLRGLIEILRKSSGFSFTVHQLRHTFATLMLEGGCDIYSLSRMMGHDDIKTTTIYLAASADHLRAQMTKHPLGAGGLAASANRVPSQEAWEPDPRGLYGTYPATD
jgi:site-specific recombinase XerD